ncbi:MAG: hypothetical protein R3E68_09740 [Burkholderiaceae bacterium]
MQGKGPVIEKNRLIPIVRDGRLQDLYLGLRLPRRSMIRMRQVASAA